MMLVYRIAETDRNSLATIRMMTDAHSDLMTGPRKCNILSSCITSRLWCSGWQWAETCKKYCMFYLLS